MSFPETYHTGDSIRIGEPVLNREGYDFGGWLVNGNEAQQDESDLWQIIAPQDYTNKLVEASGWTAKPCQVTFLRNWEGDQGDDASQVVDERIVPYWDEVGDLPTPTAQQTPRGKRFVGWFKEREGGSQVDKYMQVRGEDVFLYAHWTNIVYTISYDMNGHGEEPANLKYLYTIDETPYDPADGIDAPSETGYVFMGWSPAKIDEGSVGNKKFIAQWRPAQYKIRYDGNGNTSGGMADEEHQYDQPRNLPPN